MTIPLAIAGLCLFGLAALLAWAAVSDMQRYLIPNRISLGILCAYAVYAINASFLPASYPSVNWFYGLMVGGMVLIVGTALFAKGMVGGGDVKMLATTSLWAGPDLFLGYLTVTAVIGGIMALGIMVHRFLRKPACDGPQEPTSPPQLPYGVAIAAGGFYVAVRLSEGLLDKAF